MKLTKINLVNFRNYSNLSLMLGNGMNIFVGDNAQGKTNILEAITILALTKSHRIGVNPNLIMFNKQRCKIGGTVKNKRVISKLEVEISEEIKKLMINKKEVRKVVDYISYLNIIIFTPDDLEIVKGSPSIRRNLLNIQLSQISKIYLKSYNEYNKLLKTRNEYLKILFNNSIADNKFLLILGDKNYLDIITDKLIEKAILIYQKRKEYIDLVNLKINQFFYNISGEQGVFVKYIPNIEFDNYDSEYLRKRLKHTYKKNYLKELNYGMTIYGPHRDDFYFDYNGRDLKIYGSQGQQKLAILSFKLAEIDIFENFCETLPVLLLDDIFSELDIKKRNKLLKIISENDIQSIITTTDLRNINKKYLETAQIFKVINGNVERK